MPVRCLLCFGPLLAAFALLIALPAAPAADDDRDRLPVGVQPDGRIVVPTNQVLKPAGKQVTFPGRALDLALTEDSKTLVVKTHRGLLFLDVDKGEIKQTLNSSAQPGTKPGFSVTGLQVRGDRVYVSDVASGIRVARRNVDGEYQWDDSLILNPPRVGGAAHPAGLTLAGDDLWVTSTRGNTVQRFDLTAGVAEQTIPVGVAPYTILLARADRAYVSNWGGDAPAAGDPQGSTSGTPIHVDPRTGVADRGSVSVLAAVPGKWKQLKTIPVGLHPCAMILGPKKRFLYVANAASDTVSVIDTTRDEVVETIACRPEARLPFGSGPNALALSPQGDTLYVANGTNNCVAVVRLGARASVDAPKDAPADSSVAGQVPTGWFPGALLLSPDGKTLMVGNVKGHGALSQPRPVEKGKNSHDVLGSVSLIPVPDNDQLARYTEEVNRNNRLAYSLNGLEKPRSDVAAIPVPRRHGEPSVFQHVIYIIKENRTYDQVLGDMKEGNGDPKLLLYGEEVTPNHHQLAREFTLFDNFYCSGELSADGHTWTNQAIVTDYLEKAFGGFARSYPDDGSDPLAYAPTGFLWDNALARKKTFRNFGEYTRPDYAPKKTTWADLYADYKDGKRTVKLTVEPTIKTLVPHTHPGYPWFPLITPDVYRAQLFAEELKDYERKGDMPNLIYLTLPCDHTAGTSPKYPRPRSMVADNDLALGRIVQAVSTSKFWADTCIFVVEDDPQDGFDHVDAHRTVALVISPYTKRHFVDHTTYNQTGMVKTIELLLGLPPMNQLDLSATPMTNCFQVKPDLTPYACLPSRVALDDMNPDLDKLKGQARHWAEKSLALDFNEGDKADEDTLNRILWHAAHGDGVAYPKRDVDDDDDD